jgi:hypothetical protein
VDDKLRELARQRIWGPHQQALYEMGADVANRVYDPAFRQERTALVAAHAQWSTEQAPDPGSLSGRLARIRAHDERMAYLNHERALLGAGPEPAAVIASELGAQHVEEALEDAGIPEGRSSPGVTASSIASKTRRQSAPRSA